MAPGTGFVPSPHGLPPLHRIAVPAAVNGDDAVEDVVSASDEDEEGSVSAPLMDPKTGLPSMDEDAKQQALKGSLVMVTVLLFVPRLIGFAVAIAIYSGAGSAKYVRRMEWLNGVGGISGGENSFGFLYVAIGLLSVLVSCLNLFPMIFKEQVLPRSSGNLRSNPMIYKVNVIEGARLPYIVMEQEGELGEYNRSNRSLMHFAENGIPIALNVVAAGLIFPMPVMVLTIFFCIFRIWYMFAYSLRGYGCTGHAPPLILAHNVVAPTLEMLVWIIAAEMPGGFA
eukprot:gnl/TRDRNA2_/TRDRNA2_131465_c0_seq1.p1 gnl/TRDRNA2_/TRDRNA2_131465_c0~~gnl/TRDRNA2_/TRDRNA2_131465_c0_seq1.p1  ORF type:complete len:295 (-),score=20.68 gnl/TRDRNA2_/TRDRNA2_131465_c0_seq1:46-894(-)